MTNLCLGMEKNPLASPFPSQTQNPFSKTSRFSHSSSFLPQTFSPFETPTPARRTLRCPSNELSNATPFKNRTVEFLSSPLGPVLQPSPTLPAISPIPPKDLLDWNELDFSTAATEILSFAGLTVSQTLIDKLVKYFRDTNHNHLAIGRVVIIGENPKTKDGKREIFPIPNIFVSGTSSDSVRGKWDDRITDPDLSKIPVQSIGESGFECSPGTQAFYAHSERALITSLFQSTTPWNMEHIMSEYFRKYVEYVINRIVIQIKIIHPKGVCRNCHKFFESKATVADDLLFIGSPKSLNQKVRQKLNERYTENLKKLNEIDEQLKSIQTQTSQNISEIKKIWDQQYGQFPDLEYQWENMIYSLSPISDKEARTENLQYFVQKSSETPLSMIPQIQNELDELQNLDKQASEMYYKNSSESLRILLNMNILIENLQKMKQCVHDILNQRLANELQPTSQIFDIGTHARRAIETAFYRTSSLTPNLLSESDDSSSESDTDTRSLNTISSYSSTPFSNPSTPKLSDSSTSSLSAYSATPNPYPDSDTPLSPGSAPDFSTSFAQEMSTDPFPISTSTSKYPYPNVDVYVMASTSNLSGYSRSTGSDNKTVLYKYFRDLQGMANEAAQESE